MEDRSRIENDREFKRTDSDKANQLGPSSPYERERSSHPQSDAAHQSADNDMDRDALQHDLKKEADEAQSDGNISFPAGK